MTKRSKLARSGKGKVVNRGYGKYEKIFVYVPRDISSDTAFPFRIGEDVDVEIAGRDSLLIKKRKSWPS